MSTPTNRGQRGGSATRAGGRATPFHPTRGRGSSRGGAIPTTTPRGRGRGIGGAPQAAANVNGDGLLQKLRAGTVKRSSEDATITPGGGMRPRTRAYDHTEPPTKPPAGRGGGAPASNRGSLSPFSTRARGRGRGRGSVSQNFNEVKAPTSATPSRTSSPAPSNQRDFMNAAIDRFTVLKQEREGERAQAIRDGFLADPDKKTSLDNAITPVGTCTDMCPAFERVERIVQNMVDKAEKIHNDDTGKDVPAEDRMVKRFRRSAAGYDEQLPSDIRTPNTLRRTLDYLLDKIIGGDERLATVHKYVWDRTRGIRNDFSIQQVTKPEDVTIAVECYERIARFHILSLHQLANADNLWEGENFDAHQEREQLNNTLLSLLYYYDDHRKHIDFPNEGEFRAYCIIFELQSQNPDLEDRVQSWPENLLKDQRVKTALKLYKAAGNTLFDQGPLRPMETFAIAQNNSGSFWNVLSSNAVPYIMACVAEIYFGPVRFAALDALWHSAKSAPAGQQAKSRDWSLLDLTEYLRFDTEEETKDFCGAFELDFTTDDGAEYLNPTSNSDINLDQSSIPRQQSFSYNLVEKKRYRRTLTAVINGASVAQAIREGWVEPDEEVGSEQAESRDDEQSLFVPESTAFGGSMTSSTFGTGLNPGASIFKPSASQPPMEKSSSFGQPTDFGKFGIPASLSNSTSFGHPTTTASTQAATMPENGSSIFGKPAVEEKKSFSSVGWPPSSAAPASSQSFSFAAPTQPAPIQLPPTPSPSIFGTFGVPKKDEASAMAPAPQPAFSGFNFGKEAPVPVAAAPSTIQQSGATITSVAAAPSIFESSDPSFPSFPAGSLRSPDGPATASTPSSAAPSTPFKFPSFNFANPSTTPSGQPPQLQQQSSNTQSTISEPASTSQPFKFATSSSQALPQSSHPAPSATTATAGFTFQSTAPAPQGSPSSIREQLQISAPPGIGINPPSQAFNFSPVKTPTGSPSPSIEKKPLDPKPFSTLATTPNAPSPLRQSVPPQQTPPTASSEPTFTQKDKDRLTRDFARVALLRPNGLIQHYVEYNLPEIVKSVFIQHHRDIHDAAVASIRERIIMRKFANLWRSLTWNKILHRKADNRRQQFSETIKANGAKKKKSEEELEAILAAVQETKRIQRTMQEQAELAEDVKEMIAARKKEYEATHGVRKVAGQKRKSLSHHDDPSNDGDSTNAGPSTPSHKRSRTLGALSEPSNSTSRYAGHIAGRFPPVSTPSFQPRSSLLGRSTSNQDLRQSRFASSVAKHEPKMLDTTKTDYFRLKALGIDPDTPLIPLTQKQLEMKKQREAEERQRMLDRFTRRRHYGGRFRAQSPPSPIPAASEPTLQVSPPPVPAESAPSTTTKAPAGEEDDDLLKQARAQRKELEEGSNWLRDTRLQLDKQIDEEVERRVEEELSTYSSHSPVTRSPNGLARVNGYEYLPASTKAGLPLSRTEQRIRTTGARGLAFKPLRSHADYVPIGVAMSKRSASKYSSELTSQQVSSPLKKSPVDHDEIDPALHDVTIPRKTFASQKTSLKKRPLDGSDDDEDHESHRPAPSNSQYQPRYTYAGDDDDESVDDSDDQVEPKEGYDDEDYLDAEEEEEDDLDEEEELFEDEDDILDPENQTYGNGGYSLPPEELIDDARTPSTNAQASRAASSAPGASADDAFVLSDSD